MLAPPLGAAVALAVGEVSPPPARNGRSRSARGSPSVIRLPAHLRKSGEPLVRPGLQRAISEGMEASPHGVRRPDPATISPPPAYAPLRPRRLPPRPLGQPVEPPLQGGGLPLG